MVQFCMCQVVLLTRHLCKWSPIGSGDPTLDDRDQPVEALETGVPHSPVLIQSPAANILQLI